jgi:DNA-binding NarL/FixJ family response regulator
VASELLAVAEVAGRRLHAEVDVDSDAVAKQSEALLGAATAALRAGHSLSDIAHAEADGQEQVRRTLRADVLRRVDRSARQAREAEAEHHRAIGRAMRLGLSTREIALSAGVTHGTIRAIASRLSETKPELGMAEPDPPGPSVAS